MYIYRYRYRYIDIYIKAYTLDSFSFCGGFERNGKHFMFMFRYLMI